MLKRIYESIDEIYDEMVEIRRYLHQNPELSFHEVKTAAFIADFYEKLAIPYEKNVGGNGIVARLKGSKPGKTVALRADFDALPIQDEKDVPYRSLNDGACHACGHDGHTATLLGIAKVMKNFQSELTGTIVFLHQHAEEIHPGGAKPMIEAGVLDGVDAIFGNHLWAQTPIGTVETRPDVFMAGVDRLEINIQGQGGHGAYPHLTKDALVIGAEIVTKLQTILSRKIDPLKTAVVTIGEFKAGTSFNVIADTAKIVGTIRYLEKDVQATVKREIKRIVEGICIANDVDCNLIYAEGYPPVINHPEETALGLEVASEIAEVEKAEIIAPQMGGEDFAYYLEERPGAFFFTGAQIEGQSYPHHHPKFDIDEKSMPIAAKLLIGTYFAYQAKHA